MQASWQRFETAVLVLVPVPLPHTLPPPADLHKVKDEWGGSQFPQVPGHEIVGVVTEVGDTVKGFTVGERAAVGCMANSCRR